MCEATTRSGQPCYRRGMFYVHVQTVPQTLPDGHGGTFTERTPAGRSNTVCAAHVAATVTALYELPIRRYGMYPTVRPMPGAMPGVHPKDA